jgi:hypothetical protein
MLCGKTCSNTPPLTHAVCSEYEPATSAPVAGVTVVRHCSRGASRSVWRPAEVSTVSPGDRLDRAVAREIKGADFQRNLRVHQILYQRRILEGSRAMTNPFHLKTSHGSPNTGGAGGFSRVLACGT